jgi:hypothetical protein
MNSLLNALPRATAVALICALWMPAANAAPKTVNPETIHREIVQRGASKWICVDLKNGTALVGRIASLDEQSFGMQLDNYPDVTTIAYADVLRVRSVGIGGKGLAIAIGAGIGGSVAIALIANHEMNNLKNNQPTLPALP